MWRLVARGPACRLISRGASKRAVWRERAGGRTCHAMLCHLKLGRRADSVGRGVWIGCGFAQSMRGCLQMFYVPGKGYVYIYFPNVPIPDTEFGAFLEMHLVCAVGAIQSH